MKEKQQLVLKLKHQIIQAQERLKHFAERSERRFSVGDWVYLRLP